MRPRFILFFHLSFYILSCCSTEDAEVLCEHMGRCALPCLFHPGPMPVINWLKKTTKGDITVYSWQDGQLQAQEEQYKGRTSLSGDVTAGNASLQLTEVRVQDEGEYACLTSTGDRDVTVSYVQLKLRAAVQKVSVHQEGQQLLCRSEKIYPRPAVTWSSSTPHNTRISPSESGLFSVSSSVLLSDSDNKYSCNISTEHSWRSATYWENPQISFSDSAVTLKCIEPETPVKRLVWKFNCEAVLTRTGSGPDHSEFWRPFIVPQTTVSSNSLVLKNLTQYQLGRYTCELSTESEEFIINTELIKAQPEQQDNTALWSALGGVSGLLIVAILVIFWLLHVRHRNIQAHEEMKREQTDGRRTEMNGLWPGE